jgi:hypothetical protein
VIINLSSVFLNVEPIVCPKSNWRESPDLMFRDCLCRDVDGVKYLGWGCYCCFCYRLLFFSLRILAMYSESIILSTESSSRLSP